MSELIFFVVGLIFITSLYGLWIGYVSSWFLVLGLIFSSFVLGLVIGERL